MLVHELRKFLELDTEETQFRSERKTLNVLATDGSLGFESTDLVGVQVTDKAFYIEAHLTTDDSIGLPAEELKDILMKDENQDKKVIVSTTDFTGRYDESDPTFGDIGHSDVSYYIESTY